MKQNRTELNISNIQMKAIALLLSGTTDTETAKICRVSRSTLWRWKVEDNNFIVELNRQRQEIWGTSVDRLKSLMPKAIQVLEANIEAGGLDAQSLVAAVHILKAVGLYGISTGPETRGITEINVKLPPNLRENDLSELTDEELREHVKKQMREWVQSLKISRDELYDEVLVSS